MAEPFKPNELQPKSKDPAQADGEGIIDDGDLFQKVGPPDQVIESLPQEPTSVAPWEFEDAWPSKYEPPEIGDTSNADAPYYLFKHGSEVHQMVLDNTPSSGPETSAELADKPQDGGAPVPGPEGHHLGGRAEAAGLDSSGDAVDYREGGLPNARIKPESVGELQKALDPPAVPPGGYQALENELYQVEAPTGKLEDQALKWQREPDDTAPAGPESSEKSEGLTAGDPKAGGESLEAYDYPGEYTQRFDGVDTGGQEPTPRHTGVRGFGGDSSGILGYTDDAEPPVQNLNPKTYQIISPGMETATGPGGDTPSADASSTPTLESGPEKQGYTFDTHEDEGFEWPPPPGSSQPYREKSELQDDKDASALDDGSPKVTLSDSQPDTGAAQLDPADLPSLEPEPVPGPQPPPDPEGGSTLADLSVGETPTLSEEELPGAFALDDSDAEGLDELIDF
jgi:hypothetical protein